MKYVKERERERSIKTEFAMVKSLQNELKFRQFHTAAAVDSHIPSGAEKKNSACTYRRIIAGGVGREHWTTAVMTLERSFQFDLDCVSGSQSKFCSGDLDESNGWNNL